MLSDHIRFWHDAERIQVPTRPWELMQIGNAGPPLETEAGWLVITHGVGPMRQYALGAILLDIDDPSQVLGHLREPLLVPNEQERDGYVPNVVYSCGSIIHSNRSGDRLRSLGHIDQLRHRPGRCAARRIDVGPTGPLTPWRGSGGRAPGSRPPSVPRRTVARSNGEHHGGRGGRRRCTASTASSMLDTRYPLIPGWMISGIEPRGCAITGVPHAIASTTLNPNGSSKSIRCSSALALPRTSWRRSGPTGPR